MHDFFRTVSRRISDWLGSAWSFLLACLIVVAWALMGPALNYSQNWQMVINTGTTIVTFLMVFLIQNTQNRDTRAMQIKLDELLRGVEGARTGLVALELCSDEELDRHQKNFEALRKRLRKSGQSGQDAVIGMQLDS